jgi:nucleotide-binding universal stress UspA family protein
MSSIVVGIDRSDSAAAVASVADRIASSLGLPLILVHATTGAEPAGDLLAQTDPRSGVGSEVRTTVGEPAEALRRIALEEDAALLVIGTGSHRPLRRLFGRSTANAVLDAESRPVVLVSPAAVERERSPRPISPSAIVCSIDQSPDARRVANFAAVFAAVTLKRVVLVHDTRAQTPDPIEHPLPPEEADIATRGVDGRPPEWLEVIGAEENAGLAVISADEREARSVAAWASRPVLVVPPAAAGEATDTLTRAALGVDAGESIQALGVGAEAGADRL